MPTIPVVIVDPGLDVVYTGSSPGLPGWPGDTAPPDPANPGQPLDRFGNPVGTIYAANTWYHNIETGEWETGVTGTVGPSSDPEVPRILAEITYQPLTAARLGAPIYIGYGRFRTGGHIARVASWGSTALMLLVVWCEGEVQAIDKIYSGDVDITDDYQWAAYTGTSGQTPDSYVQSVFGQADALPGICYSVIRLPIGYSLDLTAVIRGKKVKDTRAGGDRYYTTNPALCLADFIDAYTDYALDWDSVDAAADYCDVVIAAPNIKRWEIGMVLADRKSPDEWIKVLAEYANCYVFYDNGTAKLLPDEPRAVDHVLDGSDVRAETFDLRKSGQRDTPTQVFADYLLPTGDIWTEAEAYTPDPDETEPLRVTRLKMGGFFRAIHAQRKANQFQNYANVADLSGSFEIFDKGVKITKGDVISLTHPLGLVAKEFRVLNNQAVARGRWRLEVREYSPMLYSDTVVADPDVPDSDLPDPRAIPVDVPVPSEIKEVLFTDQNGITYTRFEIHWLGINNFPFAESYRVQMSAGSVTVMDVLQHHLGADVEHVVVTPATSQGIQYTVKIWIISVLGEQSASPGIGYQTGNGNTIPPTDPTGLTGREAAQFVSLSWTPSVDSDLRGYQIRKLNQADYDAAGSSSARWNHANVQTVISRVDSTKVTLSSQAVGAWYYMLKAEDFAGNFSTNFTVKLINVTEDQAASVLEAALDEGTVVNMHVWDSRRQIGVNGGRQAVTSAGESWTTMFGAAGSAWTANFSPGDSWIANHNVASSLETEVWDSTKDNNGNWIFQSNITALGGASLTYTTRLAKAADYPTFTDINGQSVNGEGRYYKAKVAAAAALGAGFQIIIPIDATFAGVRVYDQDTESVPSSPQPLAVTFNKTFGYAPIVRAQLVGTTPGFALPDSITTTGFDLYVWDTSGSPMAGTVSWSAEGI